MLLSPLKTQMHRWAKTDRELQWWRPVRIVKINRGSEKASSRVQHNFRVAPSREVRRPRTAWFRSRRSNVCRRRWGRSWYLRNSFSTFRHGSRTQRKERGQMLLMTLIPNILQASKLKKKQQKKTSKQQWEMQILTTEYFNQRSSFGLRFTCQTEAV